MTYPHPLLLVVPLIPPRDRLGRQRTPHCGCTRHPHAPLTPTQTTRTHTPPQTPLTHTATPTAPHALHGRLPLGRGGWAREFEIFVGLRLGQVLDHVRRRLSGLGPHRGECLAPPGSRGSSGSGGSGGSTVGSRGSGSVVGSRGSGVVAEAEPCQTLWLGGGKGRRECVRMHIGTLARNETNITKWCVYVST